MGLAGGALIFISQCIYWLMTGQWSSLPLEIMLGGVLRSIGASWIGLQSLFAWMLKLPLSLFLVLLGVLLFWGLGALAAERYRKRVRSATPAQTQA
jgi:hypothetical protein